MSERRKLISAMLEEDGNDPFLHYALALEYLKEGKKDEAIATFRHLVGSHPDYLPTFYQLGKCLESKGELKHALRAYQQGIEVAESQADRKAQGELREALMLLEDLIEDQGLTS